MALLLTPWSLLDFCVAHPLGHDHHHEPGKPTPCELRKQYNGDEPAIWPLMDCHTFDINADDYQTTNEFRLKPTTHTITVVAVLLDLYDFDYVREPDQVPPDPRCRSATVISANKLRGPPLV